MIAALLRARACGGAYLERDAGVPPRRGGLELCARWLRGSYGAWRPERMLVQAAASSVELVAKSDAELLEAALELRRAARRQHGPQARAYALAFAFEAARRALRTPPELADWHTAGAMLQGCVCERPERQGADRALLLAACAGAFGGLPVHVLSASEARARGLARGIEPVARRLGLSVQLVARGSEREARQQAYGADVVCASAGRVAGDYLSDQRLLGPGSLWRRTQLAVERLHAAAPRADALLLRGLGLALLADADRLLLDWAAAPPAAHTAAESDRPAVPLIRLLRRYWSIGGVADSVQGAAAELRRLYRVSPLRLARAPQLQLEERLFASGAARDRALAERIRAGAAAGQCIAVIAQPPARARAVIGALRAAGLDPSAPDCFVFSGGELALPRGRRSPGELHVLLAGCPDSGRHEQRLLRRLQRERPESAQLFAALDDPPLAALGSLLARWRLAPGPELAPPLGAWLRRLAQRHSERAARRARRAAALTGASTPSGAPSAGSSWL